MKAMVLTAAGELSCEDRQCPDPRFGECLVKITHSGVCGTDLKIFQGGIPVDYPRIMGHEMIGKVVESVGDDSINPGDRVIIDPVVFCGSCPLCLAGKENLCKQGHLLGRDCDGGFSEYMRVPSKAVFPLTASIDDNSAPLIQVMTTCVHAQRLAPVHKGETVIVIGLGVTGLLHVQLAKASGAERVIGITRSPKRRAVAEQLGADATFDPGDDVLSKVRELCVHDGGDLVIESSGSIDSLAMGIELARTGGRLLLCGIFTQKKMALPLYQLYYKELSIYNGRAAKREDYPASIDLVKRGLVKLDPLISHILPLEDLEQAIVMLGERDEQRMKVILDHSQMG